MCTKIPLHRRYQYPHRMAISTTTATPSTTTTTATTSPKPTFKANVEEIRRRVKEEGLREKQRKRLRALLSPEARRLPKPVTTTTTEATATVSEGDGGRLAEFRCPEERGVERAWSAHGHPASCRLYYICMDGQEQPQQHGCPGGKVFNNQTQVLRCRKSQE